MQVMIPTEGTTRLSVFCQGGKGFPSNAREGGQEPLPVVPDWQFNARAGGCQAAWILWTQVIQEPSGPSPAVNGGLFFFIFAHLDSLTFLLWTWSFLFIFWSYTHRCSGITPGGNLRGPKWVLSIKAWASQAHYPCSLRSQDVRQ